MLVVLWTYYLHDLSYDSGSFKRGDDRRSDPRPLTRSLTLTRTIRTSAVFLSSITCIS